jgi:hypothetical protein
MDAPDAHQHHSRVRVLTHIKKLDDCFGQFLVRVSCVCGAKNARGPGAAGGKAQKHRNAVDTDVFSAFSTEGL